MTTEWNAAIEAAAELVGRNLVSAKEYPELILSLRRDESDEAVPVGEVSDGYHTFNELYAHRHALFIKLMRANPTISWRANNHEDGTMFEGGWFIAGMHLPHGDISYHLPIDCWELLDNSGIATSNRGPKWDGHTAADVVTRLNNWLNHPTPNAEMERDAEIKQTGITDGISWHNGYRAACKEICERFGLDNTDEIELLVKDQQLFQAFQGDVNELRDQIAKLERENTRLDIKSCIVDDMSESIDRLKAELAEARGEIEKWKSESLRIFELNAKNVAEARGEIAELKAKLNKLESY